MVQRCSWSLFFTGVIVLVCLGGQSAPLPGGRLPPGRIIYHSKFPGGGWGSIWVMKPDGTEKVRLTDGTQGDDFYPRPSPDGRKVLFQRTGWTSHLFVMDADGSNVRDLTPTAHATVGDWSPDGKKIVFGSSRDGNPEIYVMDADGSNVTRVTDDPAADTWPTFDRTGTRVYFCSQRDGVLQRCQQWGYPLNYAIYACDLDGSNLIRVTDPVYWALLPHCSPDGVSFVCHSDKVEMPCSRCSEWSIAYTELFSFAADGSTNRRITHTAMRESAARWRGDGRKIVCTAWDPCVSAPLQLWTLDSDGSNMTPITDPAVEAADGASWTWVYRFSGFLPPITANARSRFNLGSVIPVKFRLYDPDGQPLSTVVARLYVRRVLNGGTGNPVAPSPVGGRNGGNIFRWVGDHYQFNLATRAQWASAGTWKLTIQLDDGTSYSELISLR